MENETQLKRKLGLTQKSKDQVLKSIGLELNYLSHNYNHHELQKTLYFH